MSTYRMITLVTAMSILSAIACLASMPTDTVAVLKKSQDVTISTKNGYLAVKVENTDDDSLFFYSTETVGSDQTDELWNIALPFVSQNKKQSRKHKPNNGTVGMRNIYVGGTIPLKDNGNMFGSWEIGVGDVVGYEWWTSRKTTFTLGLGLGYARINTSDGLALYRNIDHQLNVVPVESGWRNFHAKIEMTSLLIPLSYTQRIVRSFGFSLSAIANLNFYTTAHSWYTDDKGMKQKECFKGLEQRVLTADLMFSLGWANALGVYVKYSPCQRFRDGYGPDFNTISVGANFAF